MSTIEEYAKEGEHHDVMDALMLLTKAYINQCGVSLGLRTVIYCAAEAWKERLAWMDLPLSEIARKEPLVRVMPYITNEYNPEEYDGYDITGMDNDELLNGCKYCIRVNEFDKDTKEVLSWGIIKCVTKQPFVPQEVVAQATDGTILKGILGDQCCAHTWIDMKEPYNNLWIRKMELVRNAKELLITAYQEYQRLHGMEKEIRELYPMYQEELEKNKEKGSYVKSCVFDNIYGELLNDTVLGFPEKLFNDWFGLDFFIVS